MAFRRVGILQSDVTRQRFLLGFFVYRLIEVDAFSAVGFHRDPIVLAADLERVPPIGRFIRPRLDGDETVQRPGAVAVVATGVGDLHFVTGHKQHVIGPESQVGARADEHPAVAPLGDLPLDFQDEVLETLLRTQPLATLAAVRVDDPVLDRPSFLPAHDVPTIEVLAVEE